MQEFFIAHRNSSHFYIHGKKTSPAESLTPTLLKNFWYGIEHSSNIQTQPKSLTFMGHDLVLYRGKLGQAIATQLLNGCIFVTSSCPP
jgi:hypothetical protein